jgi:hypothetical protein
MILRPDMPRALSPFGRVETFSPPLVNPLHKFFELRIASPKFSASAENPLELAL